MPGRRTCVSKAGRAVPPPSGALSPQGPAAHGRDNGQGLTPGEEARAVREGGGRSRSAAGRCRGRGPDEMDASGFGGHATCGPLVCLDMTSTH